MNKNTIFAIIPITLATGELTIILSFWGYFIFLITMFTACVYTVMISKINKDLIDYPLFAFFILSIVSGFLSPQQEKAIIYSAYWLISYMSILIFFSNIKELTIYRIVQLLFLICFLEFCIRIALLMGALETIFIA